MAKKKGDNIAMYISGHASEESVNAIGGQVREVLASGAEQETLRAALAVLKVAYAPSGGHSISGCNIEMGGRDDD